MSGIFFMFLLLSADFFFKIKLFKNFFQEHRESNGLDPDEDQLSVSPDLGPHCL